MLKRIKGQSILEYAMIIAVVVGALIAMQIYMKRGMEGRIRQASDEIGKQFEAEATKVVSTQTRKGKTVETTLKGQTTATTAVGAGEQEEVTSKGSEEVSAW
jgi:hypothetical protein